MPSVTATSPVSVTLNNGDAQISHSLAEVAETTHNFLLIIILQVPV